MVLVALAIVLYCSAWLVWCAFRDGAVPDVFWLLSGEPIFRYLETQWENAKRLLSTIRNDPVEGTIRNVPLVRVFRYLKERWGRPA